MQLGKKNIEENLFDERYEILETLSSSAETLIYKALDVKSPESKPVVLKVFSFKENNREDLIERAKKEALILYTIQNEHVPALLDCIQTDEYCYLVLDFAEKGDLQFALSTRTMPFDYKKAIFYVLQILQALKAIHEAGIIHRSLSPEHVLIDENDKVFICGFGSSHYECVTQVGRINCKLGYFDYLAPEVSLYGLYSKSADLYAVGVILYQLLTRRLPFQADSQERLREKKEQGSFRPLVDAIKNPPPFFNELLRKALHADLNERFTSAGHFKSALEDYLASYRHAPAFTKPEVLWTKGNTESCDLNSTEKMSSKAKESGVSDSSQEHLIVVKTFEKTPEEKYKAKSKISKFSLCVATAICALLMITVAKTILEKTSQAEAVIQTKVIEQEIPEKIIPPQLSSKEQLIEEISIQAQKIKNIEKQLEQSPAVIYKSQASSITEDQLKQLSLEQLNALKSLREKRIQLLSKKLENVLDSDSF